MKSNYSVRIFSHKWRVEFRPEVSMDREGKRRWGVSTLYGATFPKSRLITLREGMTVMETVDTVCHEVFHACVSYVAPEEFHATEAGTACAKLLRDFGLLPEEANEDTAY